ncbi:hypothetical protein HYT25_01715 [Candidatus Pacearchaeota archaeon]|nr:hypothetical protein [Candidatus Pacearchaeota archaeon]
MNNLDDKIHEEVKELIRQGICDESLGRIRTWCLYYKESGCPETCTYSKKINNGKI